jgi:cation-transporting ATPase 13A2
MDPQGSVLVELVRASFDFSKFEKSNYRLGMTGTIFEFLANTKPVDQVTQILRQCSVFARMNPSQKARLIELLKAANKREKTQTYVLMCGDGANDCSALKAADAGLSLADSEASIAAPFTSKVQDISCIPILLREGRACLASTIISFKYAELYAIIESFTVVILYYIGTNLTDSQYVYADLFLAFPLSIFQTYTSANNELSKHMPPPSLLSREVMTSVITQTVIQMSFLVATFKTIKEVELGNFYVDCKVQPTPGAGEYPCTKGSSVFIVMAFMLISVSIALNVTGSFRKSLLTNKILLFCMFIIFAVQISLLVNQEIFGLKHYLNIITMSSIAKNMLVWVILFNLVFTIGIEKWIHLKFANKEDRGDRENTKVKNKYA